jgi:probable phosphoglycerate mutase
MPRSKPTPGTLVFLIRHGQTPTTGATLPGRAHGLHLADKGREQASLAAERLAPFKGKVAAVYASPLERTRETAAPIARALGVRVRNAPGLVEVDVGEWTGQELKALMEAARVEAGAALPSGFRFPSGESFVDMQT